MNKKSQAFLEFMFNYGWAIMLILVFIAILVYFSDKFQVESYCVQNSDKCVCEAYNKKFIGIKEWYGNCIDNNPKEYCDRIATDEDKTKSCSQYRKKTQSELDIDDCNNNPREDDLCECISTINQWTGEEIDNIFNIREVKISCDENGTCLYYKCIKSRPKTDYEKHPEDYVAETKEITTCADPDRNANGSYQVENCGEYNINQTTYRLKNECEKEELYKDIFLKEDIIFAEGFMDYKCGDEFINNGNIVVECSKMIECII